MGTANERRRYNVTSSFIGWAHTQNDPCLLQYIYTLELPVFCALSLWYAIHQLFVDSNFQVALDLFVLSQVPVISPY